MLVEGEIDIVSAGEFEANLRSAAEDSSDDLVIDLAGLKFMDSAGMNVLARLYKVLDAQGRALVLKNATGSVRRALEIGGASVFAHLV